jgi:hypothetical protein
LSDQGQNESSQLIPFAPIRIAQLGELNAYIIYEHELDALDKFDEDLTKDPPDSVYLNFALFLLPVAISFLVTIVTTTIKSDRLYETFLVISLILFTLWRRDRNSYQLSRRALMKERETQIQRIKSRMPPNPPTQIAIIQDSEM